MAMLIAHQRIGLKLRKLEGQEICVGISLEVGNFDPLELRRNGVA